MSLSDGPKQTAWFGIDTETEAERALASEPTGLFAGIVFNRPLDQVFTYRVPEGLQAAIAPGQRVRVPLGKGDKPAIGYCVRLEHEAPANIEPKRLKAILEVLDDPPLIDATMLELTRW